MREDRIAQSLRFSISNALMLTLVVAVSIGWWCDRQQLSEERAVLQTQFTAAKKHLDHTEWIPILDTPEPILAGRSESNLIQLEGIPAIMATRIDVAETVKRQEHQFRYYVYVRSWDLDKATAILRGWWGDDVMDECTPRSPEELFDPSPMIPSVPIDEDRKRS